MSASPFTAAQLTQLQGFIELCKSNPNVLNHADLHFFKSFIESLGGRIPLHTTSKSSDVPPASSKAGPTQAEPTPPEPETESSEESDVELDLSGVIDADLEEDQPMGDESLQEVPEEAIESSNSLKMEAIAAANDGDYEKAIKMYTEAILLNPLSALNFAKRGQCYLKLNKPNACIRDCSRALLINPDNAAAYKFRGRAHRLLGHWEQAAADLSNACKIDYDEQADEWLREVAPNAKKLSEHRRKYERRHQEKELKAKLARAKKAREEHLKARQAAPPQEDAEGPPEMGDFYKFLNDPEITAAFQDPEVAAAFQDISSNPANIIKYQSNPKVAALINKMATKFGGGLPGGLGGAFAGMPGMPGGGMPGDIPPSAPPSAGDDVGLD